MTHEWKQINLITLFDILRLDPLSLLRLPWSRWVLTPFSRALEYRLTCLKALIFTATTRDPSVLVTDAERAPLIG